MSMRVLIRLSLLVVLVLFNTRFVWAHSMYQSAILLDFQARHVDAELQLPVARISYVLGRPLVQTDVLSMQPLLQSYILQRLHVYTVGGDVWSLQIVRQVAWEIVDGAPYLVAHLRMEPPVDISVRQFSLTDNVLADTIPNQVVLVSVRSDWESSTFASDPDLLGILHGEERSLVIDRSSGTWLRGFSAIFRLGLRHIAEGTDHLLFLLTLLLPAPLMHTARRWTGFAGVRHSFFQILRIVTAFTIGHSITLALATFDFVHVPSRPIESLIAVSILISALHAIRPIFPGGEALVAGGFGLIHGLAFATTLAELGLHSWERVASILAFNLGIESMQLIVVVCVIPSLMLLSLTPLYRPIRILGAIFAGTAAMGWIIERVSEQSLHVDFVVGGVAKHALALGLILFVSAVVAVCFQYGRGLNASPN